MNNGSNIHRFISIIGFILLLFSLSFMPIRIETLLGRKVELMQEQEAEDAEAEFQTMEHTFIKEQMNELNNEVTQTNSQINLLIDHTASVNDSINNLMNMAVTEPHLLDTIQELFNSGILPDEMKIDSLNHLFTEKSNRLMEQIRSFYQKDRDLKIVRSGIRGKKLKIRYLSILIPVHVGILVLAFLSGFSLFLVGLKNWKRHNQGNRDSSIEL